MYDNPTATHALFELLEGGQYPLRIHVAGSGYVRRAIPIAAAVGPVMVQSILPHPDGGGFTGVLAEMPTLGDVLRVGWLGQDLVTSVCPRCSPDFGPDGGGLVTFKAYPPDDLSLAVKIQWLGGQRGSPPTLSATVKACAAALP